jgi:hypothetical protein
LYLAAAPNAPDAEKVKELIYEIDYRQEKAAKESSPAAIAEKKQKADEEFIKKLDGVRYVFDGYLTLDIQGNKVDYGVVCLESCGELPPGWHSLDKTILKGREFTLGADHREYLCSDLKTKTVIKGIISDDGYTISTRNTCGETKIYRRER